MPPAPAQKIFTRVFDAFNDRIAAARDESRSLIGIRDTLLPRLLSGELSVPAADAALEATA
jgi:type I restriction enzyme, S subunit